MKKLVVNNLSKRFANVQALDNVSVELEEGKILAVLGPSGCGKTTLLRSIAGFETPDYGSIQVDNRVLFDRRTNIKPELRKIGYVPQHGVLFPHLSVANNIAFGLHSTTLSTAERRLRVAEMLELVGMPGLERRMPHELSGGQQQRIALARALAPSRSLVLLDEPFSALDAGLRQTLREEVKSTLASINATAIIVTHDQEEALSMADSVAVMREGQCVQVADPVTIYQHPTDIKVAKFVGEATLIPADLIPPRQAPSVLDNTALQVLEESKDLLAQTPELTEKQELQRAFCALGELPLSANSAVQSGPATIMIRPEQFLLCEPRHAQITGRVLKSIYCGHSTLLMVQTNPHCGDHEIQVRLNGAQKIVPEDIVHLCVRGEVMAYPLSL